MLPKQAKNESIYIYIYFFFWCHLGALNGKIDLIFGIYIPQCLSTFGLWRERVGGAEHREVNYLKIFFVLLEY